MTLNSPFFFRGLMAFKSMAQNQFLPREIPQCKDEFICWNVVARLSWLRRTARNLHIHVVGLHTLPDPPSQLPVISLLRNKTKCSKDFCFQSIVPLWTRCFKIRKQVLNHLKCWTVHSQTQHSCSNVLSKSTAPWFCMFWHAYVHVCACICMTTNMSRCVFKDRLIVPKKIPPVMVKDPNHPDPSKSMFSVFNPYVHRWNRNFHRLHPHLHGLPSGKLTVRPWQSSGLKD